MPSLRNQEIVRVLIEKFKNMKGMILTEYRGLTVGEISELRSRLRSFNSEYVVVKNTLSEIALKEAGVKIEDSFSGPTALVIENGDVVSSAKAVIDFAKTHEKLKVTAGYLDDRFVDATVIEQLSNLPSREVLIIKLLSSMNTPITNFVNILVTNIRELVTVLSAISKKQVV